MKFREEKFSSVSSLNSYNIDHLQIFKLIISDCFRSDNLMLPDKTCVIHPKVA